MMKLILLMRIQSQMNKVVVIGGGAAGMMAAIAAAANGAQVILIEKNEKLGKKIYITGKGRCNVTNACSTEDFFNSVIHNPKFLYSAIYGFSSDDLRKMIEDAGCPLKVERGDRVFPVSDRASDITSALHRIMKQYDVKILLNTELINIEYNNISINTDNEVETKVNNTSRKTNSSDINNKYIYQFTGITVVNNKGIKELIEADKLIIATGGFSYPSTGCTGDGHSLLKGLGHSIIDCKPSLVSLISSDYTCKLLQGLSLKNVTAELVVGDKSVYKDLGEMLFTHNGVSGPLILSASALYSDACGKYLKKHNADELKSRIIIDFKPALDEETLDKRILREFEGSMNKCFKNSLNSLFPNKLIPVIVDKSGINPEKKVNDISREERKSFVKLIKNFEVEIIGTGGFNEAIVTQGGISVKEINPSTMESKLIKDLYVAGEMLDVDALTGGYNLQIAFSTGYLAGEAAANI